MFSNTKQYMRFLGGAPTGMEYIRVGRTLLSASHRPRRRATAQFITVSITVSTMKRLL